jgi:predicted cupin superfamily sugar epimerase
MTSISPWIEKLNLQPHPEGGFYSEVYRSQREFVPGNPYEGKRSVATCIYYLLTEGGFSAFHRLASDELWTHVDGGVLTVHVIHPDGRYILNELASDRLAHHHPFLHIPGGSWFAAEPARNTDVLTTCFVAPGFEFDDFEMASTEQLSAVCPSQKNLISRLCRS